MRTETITCQQCQSTFEWLTSYDPEDALYRLLKPTLCKPCFDIEAEEEERGIRERKGRELKEGIDNYIALIQGKIPPLFRSTDIDHPRFNRRAWEKLKTWRPTPEKPWLGLIGGTGTCKSRIAYRLALDIAREWAADGSSPKVVFTPAHEITAATWAQFGGRQHDTRPSWDERTPAQQARGFLDAVREADLLLIDDLGKGRLSPAVAAELFALIDHRYVNQLPTLWTANSTPEEIAASLTEDMGAPLAGRLNDSSRIIRLQ